MNKYQQKTDHQYILLILSFLGIVLFGLVIVWVSVFGLSQYKNASTSQPQPLAQYQAEGDQLTTLKLIQDETTFVKDKRSSFWIEIDTHGGLLDTVGLVLRYDKSKLRIDELSFDNSVFTRVVLNNNNINQGFAQMTLAMDDHLQTYSGKGHLVRVYFTPLGTAESDITFDCAHTSAYLLSVNKISSCSNLQGLVVSNIRESQDDSGQGGPVASDPSQPHKTGAWCDKEYPDRPVNLKAVTGSKPGQVHLTWTKSANTTHYTVTYGEKWMEFQYGSPNIGDTDQFDVNGLKPGALYYFVVTAVNDCASSGYSDGANAYAGKAVFTAEKGTAIKTTPKATVKATPKATTLAKASPTPVLEVAPQATSSGMYDDWNSKEWTVTTSPEPSADSSSDDQDGGILLKMAKILPWIGLGVLIILGIMLVKFIKGGNDQELPTKFQNFNASDELENPTIIEKDTKTKDPLAPPFGN